MPIKGGLTYKDLLDRLISNASPEEVEVVRCKDCKHNSLNRKIGNAYCDLGIELYQLDDFCSRGERKEDG